MFAPIFGQIKNPFSFFNASGYTGEVGPNFGLLVLLNNLLKLFFVIAGLWTFLNFILAGFQFLAASGDPKAIQKAWEKIYWSLIGLLFIVGSFVLAAIFGWLLFGNPSAILNPRIFGPQEGGGGTGGEFGPPALTP